MGDSQDRQDAAEGAAPPESTPAEPIGDTAVRPDVLDPAPEATASGGDGLTGVIASLGEPEPVSAPSDTVETALDVASQAGAGTGDAAPVPETPGPAEPAIAETEPVHPEIAALQAELEADTDSEVAAAGEPDGAEEPAESLDDIAPGTVGSEADALEDARDFGLPDDRPGIPIWPFLVYIGAWVVFAGLFVWQFQQTPAGTPIYELEIYGPSIFVGLVLTAIGPLLAIVVWFSVWLARPGARAGLFSRCLIIGAMATLAGVALWLIALGAVDMLRLGRLL